MTDKDLLLTEEDLPWLYNFTVTKGNIYSVLEAQLAKALPAREEIDALKVKIENLNKKLDDRETDLIEAKKQVAEEIFGEIEEKIILVTHYAIFTRDNTQRLKDYQALKSKYLKEGG